MGRMGRGFRLAKASYQVLKADKQLMLLPLFAFLATIAVAAVLFAGAAGIGIPKDSQSLKAGHIALLAVFYFSASFITIFSNAAIVGAATIRLQGGEAGIREGLALARSKIGKIFMWSLLTATVGLVIRMLEERAGLFGRIVFAIIGAAWSAVTFFVVPVLLYEPVGVGESVKRSGSLFKQRWGEQFVGNASIGIAVFLFAIPVILIAAIAGKASPALGILIGALGLGFLGTAAAALSGIFNAALYRYATTGESSGAFTEDDLRGAFRPRRRSRSAF
ncbi:MAG: DUF6159 family protein [Actinomycetota bacterium]